MSKPKKAGAKRAQFRRAIEARLQAMGYKPSNYAWQASPARLLVIVQGGFRIFEINQGVGTAAVEYQLGRLATWAEIMELQPREPREPREGVIDIETLIAAQKQREGANGVAKSV